MYVSVGGLIVCVCVCGGGVLVGVEGVCVCACLIGACLPACCFVVVVIWFALRSAREMYRIIIVVMLLSMRG